MNQPIPIAELLILLKHSRPDAGVIFDFPGYMSPTKVASYRGYYDMPALGYDRIYGDMTVEKLREELENATDGRTYTGWKGGDFSYTKDDFLWAANPGEAQGYAITGIIDDGYQVKLKIAYHEY